jgi:hypothetical protein
MDALSSAFVMVLGTERTQGPLQQAQAWISMLLLCEKALSSALTTVKFPNFLFRGAA